MEGRRGWELLTDSLACRCRDRACPGAGAGFGQEDWCSWLETGQGALTWPIRIPTLGTHDTSQAATARRLVPESLHGVDRECLRAMGTEAGAAGRGRALHGKGGQAREPAVSSPD